MDNTELLSEYESVKDICQYVGSGSFEHSKKIMLEWQLIDRNPGAVIGQIPSFSRIQARFR